MMTDEPWFHSLTKKLPFTFYSQLEACHSNVQYTIVQFSRTLAVLANNLRTISLHAFRNCSLIGNATFARAKVALSNESEPILHNM